jgi:hypothetical protein
VTSVLSLPKDVTILISGLPDNTSADNILSPNPNLANLPFLSAQNFNFSAGEIYLDLAVFGVDSTGPFVSTTPLYSNNGPPIPPAIPPTPLPAALPLFATGLGALGLLGWRRKRKGAAVAAA